ncbi:MAG: ABC transporter substrate binding protein [Candidatus Omnitrophota bacterium]
MKKTFVLTAFLLCFLSIFSSSIYGQTHSFRIMVVSSYHREYFWSQDTHKGLCAALKDFKFIDNDQQIDEFTKNDSLVTENIVIKKFWMDTKHKNKKNEIASTTDEVVDEIKAFKPDLVFLGDDNAANFIGARLMGASVPVVFWGVDFNPLAYGYINSMEHPGHNITGVYQSGYFKESLEILKKLVPGIKTFAILSDNSETGRAKTRVIVKLSEEGQLPLRLVDQIATNSFSEWQDKAIELQGKVDAFFVLNHGTLRDDAGLSVDSLKAGAWYLANIRKLEVSPEKQFVEEGMLLSVDDSGFKQAYEAGRMADMILHQKKNPVDIAVMAPTRGAVMINRQRAQILGVDVGSKDFIEEVVDRSAALEKYP